MCEWSAKNCQLIVSHSLSANYKTSFPSSVSPFSCHQNYSVVICKYRFIQKTHQLAEFHCSLCYTYWQTNACCIFSLLFGSSKLFRKAADCEARFTTYYRKKLQRFWMGGLKGNWGLHLKPFTNFVFEPLLFFRRFHSILCNRSRICNAHKKRAKHFRGRFY